MDLVRTIMISEWTRIGRECAAGIDLAREREEIKERIRDARDQTEESRYFKRLQACWGEVGELGFLGSTFFSLYTSFLYTPFK